MSHSPTRVKEIVASINEIDALAAAHMIALKLSPARRYSFIVNQLMTMTKVERKEIMCEVGIVPNAFSHDEIIRKLDEMSKTIDQALVEAGVNG